MFWSQEVMQISKVGQQEKRLLAKSNSGEAKTLKPRPNDRNMPTQHIATLLGATCCVRLATLFRHVATCWVLLSQIWPFSNLSQQHPTCRNMSQHGGQTHTTCWAQQCWDMLRWHVAIVWPGLKLSVNSSCVVFVVSCCDSYWENDFDSTVISESSNFAWISYGFMILKWILWLFDRSKLRDSKEN